MDDIVLSFFAKYIMELTVLIPRVLQYADSFSSRKKQKGNRQTKNAILRLPVLALIKNFSEINLERNRYNPLCKI